MQTAVSGVMPLLRGLTLGGNRARVGSPMMLPSRLQSPATLSVALRELASAARTQADAIAADLSARASGHIEVMPTKEETMAMVPAATRWRRGDTVVIAAAGKLTRARVFAIHQPRRAAVLQAEARIAGGVGEIYTEYEALPRQVAMHLDGIAARADEPEHPPFDHAIPAAASLLGLEPPRVRAPLVPSAIREGLQPHLTPEQLLAWEHALRHDALVLAPPGTGKTYVLAAIALALSAIGGQVVLAAPSRSATELLYDAYRNALNSIALPDPWGARARAARPDVMTLPQAYMRGNPYPDGASMVVDEVSMATLPALVAAGRFASHFVGGGDLWQLGPVVEGPADARAVQCVPPFGVDLRAQQGSPALVRLRTSRRLPAVVADLMRALAYGPQGPVGHHAHDAPLHGTSFGAPLTLVDTGGVGPADATARLYGALRRATGPARFAGEPLHPLVITPTRARVTGLSSMLRGFAVVSTVHGAQGQEAPVTVVDLIMNTPRLDWFRATDPLDEGGRLLTVAMTRASRHAIVAVDVARFQRDAGPLWQRFFTLAASSAGVATLRVADLTP